MQNWVENTSSLARDETAYLFEPKDLMTIFSPQDAALARLTPVLEGFMRTLYRLLKKVRGPKLPCSKRSRWNLAKIYLPSSLNATFLAIRIYLYSPTRYYKG